MGVWLFIGSSPDASMGKCPFIGPGQVIASEGWSEEKRWFEGQNKFRVDPMLILLNVNIDPVPKPKNRN